MWLKYGLGLSVGEIVGLFYLVLLATLAGVIILISMRNQKEAKDDYQGTEADIRKNTGGPGLEQAAAAVGSPGDQPGSPVDALRSADHIKTGSNDLCPPEPRLFIRSRSGEIAGFGPVWACDCYGRGHHNTKTCPECERRFLAKIRQRMQQGCS